jgi:hypothetical protein
MFLATEEWCFGNPHMQDVFEFYRDVPVRPKRPERLFFGLFPDAETSIRVGRFGKRFICEHGLEGKGLKTERLHVSLQGGGAFCATYDIALRFKADPDAGDRADPLCGHRIRSQPQ